MSDSAAAHARVAEYRGADREALEAVLERVRAEVAADLGEQRPEGLEGLAEVLVLADREAGRVVAITLFEDADALRRGAAVLDRRPASQAGGVRVETASYEVALRAEGS